MSLNILNESRVIKEEIDRKINDLNVSLRVAQKLGLRIDVRGGYKDETNDCLTHTYAVECSLTLPID